MVNVFEHFVCVCTKINISFIILESTGTQQVPLDLTKIALNWFIGLLPSNYWHSEENQFSDVKKKKTVSSCILVWMFIR